MNINQYKVLSCGSPHTNGYNSLLRNGCLFFMINLLLLVVFIQKFCKVTYCTLLKPCMLSIHFTKSRPLLSCIHIDLILLKPSLNFLCFEDFIANFSDSFLLLTSSVSRPRELSAFLYDRYPSPRMI